MTAQESPQMETLRAILQRPEPAKWLFYGDSITHGARHTYGQRDYTELFAERVRAELGRSQDIVLNTAISGNTTRELLATFDWRVGQFRPDVVFLMIGMNDCNTVKNLPVEEFHRNLNELADKIHEAGALTVFQTCNPLMPGTLPERHPRLAQYMAMVRHVAGDRSAPLIDHFEHWQESANRIPFWMSNSVHPNAFGHIELAFHLFRSLGIFDPASNTCRFFNP